LPTLADYTRRLNLPPSRVLPRLILMTDEVRLADPRPAAARLARGDAVILRHYGDPQRRSLAIALRRTCRPRGVRLLIAGDVRLAVEIGADGLHLPEWRISAGDWRATRARFGLITAAAHGPAALRAAARAGVDAALLSPVFPTLSHPDSPALGALRFTALCRAAALPVYALGGIGPDNVMRLKASGLAGIAGIGGLVD